MWIRYKTFETLLTETAAAQGAMRVLREQALTTKATMEWMQLRLTQLEHERAQLIHRYMGIKIATPVFEPEQPKTGAAAMSDVPSFQDVGDEEAARLGLDWDSDGQVTQHGKVIQ